MYVNRENFKLLLERIMLDEGPGDMIYINGAPHHTAYKDGVINGEQRWSIGYGTPARAYFEVISIMEAKKRCIKWLKIAIEDLAVLIPEEKLKLFPYEKQLALINMCYNLGRPRLAKFKGMLSELNKDEVNWGKVAMCAKCSNWYAQVKNRGKRIVEQLKK